MPLPKYYGPGPNMVTWSNDRYNPPRQPSQYQNTKYFRSRPIMAQKRNDNGYIQNTKNSLQELKGQIEKFINQKFKMKSWKRK